MGSEFELFRLLAENKELGVAVFLVYTGLKSLQKAIKESTENLSKSVETSTKNLSSALDRLTNALDGVKLYKGDPKDKEKAA